MVHTVASAMFAALAVSTILCTDYRASISWRGSTAQEAGSGVRAATKNRRNASPIRARIGAPEMTTSTMDTDRCV
jgi:hypothetical protein